MNAPVSCFPASPAQVSFSGMAFPDTLVRMLSAGDGNDVFLPGLPDAP